MLAIFFAVLALVGLLQQFLGVRLIELFCAAPPVALLARPAVTVMKPLCGTEPLIELALESFFQLDYPEYQIVFGVQNQTDPVLEVVAMLQARYPARDVALVVNATEHGSNRKVSNLINMLSEAKYETLVISDADTHVPSYFLDRVLAALQEQGVGLVTTLYTGLPATPAVAARLGANQINYTFLPGTLLARKLGRRDCLGVTMALRKSVLAQTGGFEAIANNLADDQVLGRRVLAAGYKLNLAQVIPATTVPEADLGALFRHELRWARTIRALAPAAYAGSVLQFSLLWAFLAVLFSGFVIWSLILFICVLGGRIMLSRRVEAALCLPHTSELWLYLLRDFFSTIIYTASFMGNRVEWRGMSMAADSGQLAPGSRE